MRRWERTKGPVNLEGFVWKDNGNLFDLGWSECPGRLQGRHVAKHRKCLRPNDAGAPARKLAA